MKIRVMLVDDHRIVRDGLRKLLEQNKDIEVAAEADNGRAALGLVKERQPDVVLMDICMSDMNGIDATRNIISEAPQTRVVALSMHAEKRFVADMLKAGAHGYLLKDCSVDEIATAISAAMAGKTYISNEIAGMLARDALFPSSTNEPDIVSVLTAREREVLQLLADGKSTKDIAALQHVSLKTIETQRQHIMEKLGLYSVAELTKYAIRSGLTTIN